MTSQSRDNKRKTVQLLLPQLLALPDPALVVYASVCADSRQFGSPHPPFLHQVSLLQY